ncbi:MAG: RecX family transcriptional regulator [Bifidobacterium sp.]|jgi:regulatory protein|nr:RecX family transcriptional regulator [Bifidobacterium sp.]MCH4174611.1 RecX family transcriptional regulator [Bifidobacterium sp.]
MISADEFLSTMHEPLLPHAQTQAQQRVELQSVQQSSDKRLFEERTSDEQQRFELCKEAALRSLDAAPRSSSDLAKRLIRKDFEENLVEDVIHRLQELGLLNDEEYAHSLLRYCLQRDMGARGVSMEMSRKGVDADLAAELIEQASQKGNFVESAYALGRTVERRTHGMERKVQMRRLWSAGARKGHSPDMLRQVFADVFCG